MLIRHKSWGNWIEYREITYRQTNRVIREVEIVANNNTNGEILNANIARLDLSKFYQDLMKGIIVERVNILIHSPKTELSDRKYTDYESTNGAVITKNARIYLYNVRLSRKIINMHIWSTRSCWYCGKE